jgi:hypothetical protein
MCKKRILLTAIVALFSGTTVTSNAADTSASFVNLDYILHADGDKCAGVDTSTGTTDNKADTGTAAAGGGEPVSTTGPGTSGAFTTATTATAAPIAAGKTPLILNDPLASVGCQPTVVPAATVATDGDGNGAFDLTDNLTAATADQGLTISTTPQFYFNTGVGTFNDAATSIVNVIDSDAETGRPYAVEILQSGGWTIPSGDGTTNTPRYAGMVYVIDGWINQRFQVKFKLEGATFNGEPLFAIANSDQYDSTAAFTGYYPFYAFTRMKAADGQTEVSFDVQPNSTDANSTAKGAPDGTINNQSILLLLYKIEDATPLQTAGGEVKMTAELTAASFTGAQPSVNRSLERVVATSTDSLDASITSEDEGTIYISVNDNSKLFTDGSDNSSTADTVEDAFRSTTIARIGYLTLGGIDVYQPDGANLFTVGSDLGAAGESSELVINGGQFAASVSDPGKVRLFDPTGTSNPVASGVSTDGSTISIKLDNDALTAISNSTNGKGVAIEFIVDEATEINLVETPPTATLNILFEDAENIKMGDELIGELTDVPLRQIFQDGVVCWAFNVPYATVQDRFNIRITNESAVAGSMTVTLYEASGSEVVSAELTNDSGVLSVLKSEADMGTGTGTVQNLLPAGQTLFLNSEILEAALGTSWTGRAVLRIVSELPELEMLAMLRNQLMDDASQPLNNLSLGAQGISCTQGQ